MMQVLNTVQAAATDHPDSSVLCDVLRGSEALRSQSSAQPYRAVPEARGGDALEHPPNVRTHSYNGREVQGPL